METATEDGFKEFLGKDLDAAIEDACQYFNASRERLEIEILQDARNGIFGIVGARKAKIRARRARLRATVQSVLGSLSAHGKVSRPISPSPARAGAGREISASQATEETERHKEEGGCPRGFHKSCEESLPNRPLKKEAIPSALEETREILIRLLVPLVDSLPRLELFCEEGEILACVSGIDDPSHIIGRDGLVLAALQHLASRLVSRKMQAGVSIRIDVGDYRSRQEEELKELALSLAQKVSDSGKSLSTRPLSSYQRRIVHMALKGQEGIQTRSAGQGTLKRVLIQKRKAPQQENPCLS